MDPVVDQEVELGGCLPEVVGGWFECAREIGGCWESRPVVDVEEIVEFWV